MDQHPASVGGGPAGPDELRSMLPKIFEIGRFRPYTAAMTRPGTRAETAFQALRGDILAGRLLPGQRLQFNELSAQYGMSVGVLREALSRLAEQGLVLSEPQQGSRVVPVSPEDLRDLTAARLEIETMTLRRAIEAGDLAWESRLVAAHHVLDGTLQLDESDPRRVSEQWAAAHAHFHEVLLEACPIRRLREIARSLRDAAELYRRWSRHLGREEERDIPGEHRALLDAVLKRDSELAVRLLTQHIEYTTNAVLEVGSLSADDDEPAPAPARRRGAAPAAGGQPAPRGGKRQPATAASRRRASSA
jgi:DNA-binding GntR family transcriptional regulator